MTQPDQPQHTHGTSGGVPPTDDIIEQLAAETEHGYDPNQLHTREQPDHEQDDNP